MIRRLHAAYAGTALAMTTASAAALASAYPVATLSRVPGLGTRLTLPAIPTPQFGISWTDLAVSPTMLHNRALGLLFQVLIGITAGLLLVACLTVTSIGVMRAVARTDEFAVRRAVGASRRRLGQAALLEGAILGLAAITVGGGIGLSFSRSLTVAWPGSLRESATTAVPIVLLAIVLILLIAAALPLLGVRRRSTIPLGPPGKPLELIIAAFQLGVSLTVLAGTTILGSQADRLEATAEAAPSGAGRVFEVWAGGEDQEKSRSYAYLLQRMRRGSDADLSLTSGGVITGLGVADIGTTDCGRCTLGGIPFPIHPVMVAYHAVSVDTFKAMGMKVIAGRTFRDDDSWDAPRVAVVGRSLAAVHFEKQGAVGRGIQVGEGIGHWYTVVGVVDDPPATAFGARLGTPYHVYLSVLQHPPAAAQLLVRSMDASQVHQARNTLVQTAGITVRDSTGISPASLTVAETGPTRWFARTIALEGWMMLVVVVLGVFALMQMWVHSLRQELAIRRSVGSSKLRIVGFVLARASGAVIAGAAFGLWLGIIVWGTLASVIPNMPEWDAGVALRYVPLLAGAAFGGVLLPVIRVIREAPAKTFAGA